MKQKEKILAIVIVLVFVVAVALTAVNTDLFQGRLNIDWKYSRLGSPGTQVLRETNQTQRLGSPGTQVLKGDQ